MSELKQLHDAVLNGDAKTARVVTEKALADGVEPLKMVQDYMMPAMAEVGRRFESNEYFVPELLLSARAMKAALELLRPLLVGAIALRVKGIAFAMVTLAFAQAVAITAARNGDSARATQLFDQAERNFAAADDRLGSIVNVPSLVVPVVGSNMHAARELAKVGLALSRSSTSISLSAVAVFFLLMA